MRNSHNMEPDVDYLEKLGYESRDVALRALVKWFIALLIFMGVSVAAVTILYVKWVPRGTEERMLYPQMSVRVLPPPPTIQAQPVRDLDVFRQQEVGKLDSYGPADRAKGTVHIPIGRAIDIMAQHGLPARPQAPKAAAPYDPAETGGTPRATAPPISTEFAPPVIVPSVPGAGTDRR
jgi:hypothetical protein